MSGDGIRREDVGRDPSGQALVSDEAGSRLHPSGFDPSRVERLALNLRAYAYAMGAPRTEADEEVALGAARLILPALEMQS